MSIDPADPKTAAALERAGMRPPPGPVLEQLQAAWDSAGDPGEALLEVSRARWGNETKGPEEVLVVLLRKAIVLVTMERKGLFGAPRPRPRALALADYSDVAEDDEIFGHSVFFLAPDERDHFLLSWTDPGERQRMFSAIFEAHRGLYGRWGVQLDPADYEADFDRFHAQLTAEVGGDGLGAFAWAEERFGEFDIANALGFAVDWRGCEIDDAAGHTPSRRVGRLGNPEPWISTGPAAERLFLRLGEELFDAGLLGPPFDECSFDRTEEPMTARDAGPARLVALLQLAALAGRFEHPRAVEWLEVAMPGVPLVPPAVFSHDLRERFAPVGSLPEVVEEAPVELPIQGDLDVLAISSREDDRLVYSQDGLTEADNALIRDFFVADGQLSPATSAGDLAAVCLLGVKAFEGLSGGAPAGWRKLILFAVSELTYDLWERHEAGDPATKLAQWVVATIEANDWGPDGRSTPLGQQHSYAMGVAVRAGEGVVLIDPETGVARAATGEDARRAAAAGSF